jgi:hypothetical protein
MRNLFSVLLKFILIICNWFFYPFLFILSKLFNLLGGSRIKTRLQALLNFINSNIGSYILQLLLFIIARIYTNFIKVHMNLSNFSKTKPTLFKIITLISGISIFLKIVAKIEFIKLFNVLINLLTFGYVFNLTDILNEILNNIKDIHFSLNAIIRSLDNFYISIKNSMNDFAEYLIRKIKDITNIFNNSKTIDQQSVGENVEEVRASQQKDSYIRKYTYTEIILYTLLGSATIYVSILFITIFFPGLFGLNPEDVALNFTWADIGNNVQHHIVNIPNYLINTATYIGNTTTNFFHSCYNYFATPAIPHVNPTDQVVVAQAANATDTTQVVNTTQAPLSPPSAAATSDQLSDFEHYFPLPDSPISSAGSLTPTGTKSPIPAPDAVSDVWSS